ncbi:hypothetical protein GIB67_015704 [Kingdonia uniflora]|uniref:Uncharacterized protein n=1 Tax=Kingdonia uniflora TaxID=39325 RepID=A0A7J7NUU3_9MAGN|nr:hypothetical protein GIB67_015704 [Kingdonia uniflora]
MCAREPDDKVKSSAGIDGKSNTYCPTFETTYEYQRSFSSCCLGTLMDLEKVTPSNWTPVVDDLLLIIGVFLTYMAGIIPSQKAYSSSRQIVSNYDAVTANLTSLGSDMSSEFNPMEGSCYDLKFLVQHGVDILEDLVITLSDGITGLYLELISVDSDMSSEMSRLGLDLCSLSTRALQRLRNEVALDRWLHQNIESIVSMYEDRFDLWTFQIQPLERPDINQSEERLLLEFSDITMPFIRSAVEKISSAISFFLVCLTGRSSSRLPFQDEFDDYEFSCPFLFDDDDLTDPGLSTVAQGITIETSLKNCKASMKFTLVEEEGYGVSIFHKESTEEDGKGTAYWYDGDSTIGHRLYKEITKVEFVKMKGKGRLTQPTNSYQCIIVTEVESFKQIGL